MARLCHLQSGTPPNHLVGDPLNDSTGRCFCSIQQWNVVHQSNELQSSHGWFARVLLPLEILVSVRRYDDVHFEFRRGGRKRPCRSESDWLNGHRNILELDSRTSHKVSCGSKDGLTFCLEPLGTRFTVGAIDIVGNEIVVCFTVIAILETIDPWIFFSVMMIFMVGIL